ncbi:MAG: tripartite tricarboxylate transporter substrate binding protein, partial [Alphaproteobacteria bacterium]|nr:tripartite tricarboxylate transporter substrate binding protein [Alphaproteobacteria bacterium]
MRRVRWLVAAVVALLPGFGYAETWPSKPMRWIVPFAAGGSLDTAARIFAVPMGAAFKQQIVIENRAGASGNIGADAAAKAAPDGYTMLFSTVSLSINETLYPKLPFNLKKDLIPVVQVAVLPNVMVVPPSLPATTIQEFVALAKQKPGQLNFGSGGTGTSVHSMGELFKLKAGID